MVHVAWIETNPATTELRPQPDVASRAKAVEDVFDVLRQRAQLHGASRPRIALAELGAAIQDHRDGVAAIVEFHLVHQLAYQINTAAAVAEAVARQGRVWEVPRVEAAAFVRHAY